MNLLFIQCENRSFSFPSAPDIAYTSGSLRGIYDSSGMASYVAFNFSYSGPGDGDDMNSTIINFEAALYAYSYDQGECLFDTPFSVTEGAKLRNLTPPPPIPYPMIIQPIHTSTLSPKEPVVTLKVPATANLGGSLFEPHRYITCHDSPEDSTICRRINFCTQLQILLCDGSLIDFLDTHIQAEFDFFTDDASCKDGCFKLHGSGDDDDDNGDNGGNIFADIGAVAVDVGAVAVNAVLIVTNFVVNVLFSGFLAVFVLVSFVI